MSITNFGFTPRTAEESLTLWQDAFVTLFGSDVNLDPQSINGQLIEQLAKVDINNHSTASLLFSSLYNPNQASSIWLDAICALTGIKRLTASSTIVTCQITGVVGTVIPANSQISNNTGDLFQLLTEVTIDGTGNATGIFSSLETGPIPANANTVNVIISNLQGWESVNNSSAGVLGSDVENDNELRSRRALYLSSQGSASINSIQAALLNADEVTDAKVIENKKPVTTVVNGISLVGISIMASVIGGTVDSIGEALREKVSAGCGFNGNTTETYNYTYEGQILPYEFTYQVPTEVAVGIDIIVYNQGDFTVDTPDLIKDSIFNNWNGEADISGLTKVGLGDVVNTTRFVPSLILDGIYQTKSIYIGEAGSVGTDVEITVPITQVLTLDKADITVTII